jgi:hypothetical protein
MYWGPVVYCAPAPTLRLIDSDGPFTVAAAHDLEPIGVGADFTDPACILGRGGINTGSDDLGLFCHGAMLSLLVAGLCTDMLVKRGYDSVEVFWKRGTAVGHYGPDGRKRTYPDYYPGGFIPPGIGPIGEMIHPTRNQLIRGSIRLDRTFRIGKRII